MARAFALLMKSRPQADGKSLAEQSCGSSLFRHGGLFHHVRPRPPAPGLPTPALGVDPDWYGRGLHHDLRDPPGRCPRSPSISNTRAWQKGLEGAAAAPMPTLRETPRRPATSSSASEPRPGRPSPSSSLFTISGGESTRFRPPPGWSLPTDADLALDRGPVGWPLFFSVVLHRGGS